MQFHMRNLIRYENLITLTIASIFVMTVVFLTETNQVFAQEAKFAIQATQKSMQDPLPGHEGHQIVIALPPRDDGKFYTGTVTYVASQPVEVSRYFIHITPLQLTRLMGNP